MMNIQNIPNFLTLCRLFSSVIFSFLLITLLPLDIAWLNYLLAILFVVICSTDFFDGFLARKLNVSTALGGALDHIADKFFMVACFLALVYLHKLLYLSGLVFVLREIYVLALRNIALTKGFNIDVSDWGKFKMAVQCSLITVAIINMSKEFSWDNNMDVLQISLTSASIALSLFSVYLYSMDFKKKVPLQDL